ncbi:hypothetical protein AVEN_7419-1 [Araneus ventricosus]|uniref:Uncharacterized protein n=1 Tax=Araneus ventricosus TaxID=182803 RepID=A0A4Y2H1I7_ARAVE|nr:hypothetical protein AVEN_7419-1 [Araneus ventricosus]
MNAVSIPGSEELEVLSLSCIEIVQDLLKNTSSVLHTAIGIPIASATFLLPPSWPTETWEDITVTPAQREQTERRSNIRVDGSEDSPSPFSTPDVEWPVTELS